MTLRQSSNIGVVVGHESQVRLLGEIALVSRLALPIQPVLLDDRTERHTDDVVEQRRLRLLRLVASHGIIPSSAGVRDRKRVIH